jgi:hypothetical protein
LVFGQTEGEENKKNCQCQIVFPTGELGIMDPLPLPPSCTNIRLLVLRKKETIFFFFSSWGQTLSLEVRDQVSAWSEEIPLSYIMSS